MNKEEIAPGIMVYKDVVFGYQDLIDDIEASVEMKAITWAQAYVKSGDSNGVDTNSRDTLTIPIPYNSSMEENNSSPSASFNSSVSNIFYLSFNSIEKDYMQNYGVSFKNHSEWSILKYGIGQKFENHIDDHSDYPRRISTVYYINDDYSGGEINFPRFGVSYKPAANEMLVFPSTYVYNHSVSPVTDGTRYAVVGWIH